METLLNKSLESEKTLEYERKQQEEMQSLLRNQEVDRTNINASVNQAREDLEKFKFGSIQKIDWLLFWLR